MATLCNFSYYPFTFLMRSTDGAVPCRLYHFRSTRTNQWYIVRVEEYPHHFYGIKFYLKADALNPHKYSRMTHLNEARPVIRTCIAILLEIAENDLSASFGFIGANMEGEGSAETKRFRVYRRILTSYFSQEKFEHYQIIQQSAYAMVRRTELEKNPHIIEQISIYFSDNYTNFD